MAAPKCNSCKNYSYAAGCSLEPKDYYRFRDCVTGAADYYEGNEREIEDEITLQDLQRLSDRQGHPESDEKGADEVQGRALRQSDIGRLSASLGVLLDSIGANGLAEEASERFH